MDKLKPILDQRFWILLVTAIPLSLFGFFKTNASLKAKTEARVAALEKVKSGVPKGSEPNADFESGLKAICDVREESVVKGIWSIWENQQKRTVWPEVVQAYAPEQYWGPFKDQANTGLKYRNQYEELFQKLWESFEPVVASGEKTKWTQKLYIDIGVISPKRTILGNTINAEQMWEAQEDLWLFAGLSEVIRKVNARADGPMTAVVREVLKCRIFGADGKEALYAESGGGGGLTTSSASGSPPSLPASGGGGGGGASRVGAAFEISQEFGVDKSESGGGTSTAPLLSSSSTPASGPPGGAASTAADAGPRYLNNKKREKGKESTDPFFERGFYLSVIVQQHKIPDFLTELSSCSWPTRIVRFQMAPNPRAKDLPWLPRASTTGRTNPGGGSGFSPMTSGEPSFGSVSSSSSPGLTSPSMTRLEADVDLSALGGSDLVQLDVAGAITIYNKPTAPVEKPVIAGTAPVTGASVPPKPEAPKVEASPAASPATAPPKKSADDDDEDAMPAKTEAEEMPEKAADEPADPAMNADEDDAKPATPEKKLAPKPMAGDE